MDHCAQLYSDIQEKNIILKNIKYLKFNLDFGLYYFDNTIDFLAKHFPDLQKLFIPSIDDLPWDKYSPEHIQKLNNLGIERPKDISTSLEPDYNIEQFLDLQKT